MVGPGGSSEPWRAAHIGPGLRLERAVEVRLALEDFSAGLGLQAQAWLESAAL